MYIRVFLLVFSYGNLLSAGLLYKIQDFAEAIAPTVCVPQTAILNIVNKFNLTFWDKCVMSYWQLETGKNPALVNNLHIAIASLPSK